MINEKLRGHMVAAIESGVRRDGRKLDEFRPILIETDVSSTAHGSARVTCGNTIIVAGTKMEVGTPYSDTPDEGSLMIGAELLPIANPHYEAGPPGEEAIEVARVIDRCIREAKAIDLKALSISSGEKMWICAVDLAPMSADGNLIDLGALAALASIRNARLPELVDGVPNYEKLTQTHLPVQHYPILVTVYKMGAAYLVDPTWEEEQYCDARLSVATLDEKTISALQKGGSGPLSTKDIDEMTSLALRIGVELRQKVMNNG